MAKKFTKSTENKVLMGLCGGVAEYFDIDAMLVRIGVALVGAANPVGALIVYVVAALLMDKRNENK